MSHVISVVVAVVEDLFNLLYTIYTKQLLELNIGYQFNKDNMCKMNEIINAMYYIQHANPTNDEILKIIQHYVKL